MSFYIDLAIMPLYFTLYPAVIHDEKLHSSQTLYSVMAFHLRIKVLPTRLDTRNCYETDQLTTDLWWWWR